MQYRYHIDLNDDTGSFRSDAIAQTVGGRLVSTVQNYDGRHDRAIIDVAEDAAEELERVLDGDDNVTHYWSTERE